MRARTDIAHLFTSPPFFRLLIIRVAPPPPYLAGVCWIRQNVADRRRSPTCSLRGFPSFSIQVDYDFSLAFSLRVGVEDTSHAACLFLAGYYSSLDFCTY